jgi:AcrR family transcriptional regulator
MRNRAMTAVSESTTRERIVAAALDLFARQGYHGTSVGEIERAAGLSPRSGALYKHFPSKEAVLEAAMLQRSEAIDHIDDILAMLPLGDLHSELRLLARYALHEIGAEQQILRIIMKEGDQFPELRADFYRRFVRRGYGQAREWTRQTLARHGVEVEDLDALVTAIFGSIIHYPVMSTLFGEPPNGVDEDRFVEAWAQTGLMLLNAMGVTDEARLEEAQT